MLYTSWTIGRCGSGGFNFCSGEFVDTCGVVVLWSFLTHRRSRWAYNLFHLVCPYQGSIHSWGRGEIAGGFCPDYVIQESGMLLCVALSSRWRKRVMNARSLKPWRETSMTHVTSRIDHPHLAHCRPRHSWVDLTKHFRTTSDDLEALHRSLPLSMCS